MNVENNKKNTILIVDDTPSNISLLLDYLGQQGFEVLVARDGESAIEQAQFAIPDLILLDVMMPGIDGFETCCRLKEIDETKGIPIIFMTALADSKDKVRGFNAGAVDYVTKPIQQEEVLARVKTHLSIRNLHKELLEKNLHLQQEITERKQAEAALRQAEKMASLGKLVAGIAHEVNTPIGAVNSAADTNNRCLKTIANIVKDSDIEKNDDLQQALNSLKNNIQVTATAGDRIAEIVKGLKNFARLDEAEFQQADIHEGINNTLTLLNCELKEKVTVIRDYGKIPKIFIYAGELNQVFMNILSNAIQAIENKGTIKIKTSTEKNNVCVQISDTGKGIPPEDINKIFDPGFTTKGVGVGTGLALAICYQIIQKHKGEIRVESQLGEGSTFTIILPADLDKLIGAGSESYSKMK